MIAPAAAGLQTGLLQPAGIIEAADRSAGNAR